MRTATPGRRISGPIIGGELRGCSCLIIFSRLISLSVQTFKHFPLLDQSVLIDKSLQYVIPFPEFWLFIHSPFGRQVSLVSPSLGSPPGALGTIEGTAHADTVIRVIGAWLQTLCANIENENERFGSRR